MQYLRQFLWIIGFTLAGEALHALLPLPLPAAIYGLVLLFLALETDLLPLSSVKEFGEFLLKLMPVLFVAPAVNLIGSWPLLSNVWVSVLCIIVLSTLVVFAVSGRVTQMLLGHAEAAKAEDTEANGND